MQYSMVGRIPFNLRHFQKIANHKKNSVKMGLETISYRACQLRNLVPVEIKQTLSIFKEKIKAWHCGNCFALETFLSVLLKYAFSDTRCKLVCTTIRRIRV